MGASQSYTETILLETKKMNPSSLSYTHFRARFFESRLDIPKAIFYFEQTLDFNELHRNPKDLSSVLYHLALLNFLIGNDQKAIKFAYLCLNSSPKHKIAQAVLDWCENDQPVKSANAFSTRNRMMLERFNAEPIPIIKAFKIKRAVEDANPGLNGSTTPQNFWSQNDHRLANFQDLHKGKRAFILGNGPSLSIADLDKLKDEITFASNKIYLAFEQTDWRPTYYSVVDHLVMKNNQKQIDKLKGSVKFFPFYLDCCPPPTDDQLIFFDIVEDYFPREPKFGTNFIDGIYWGATVTYSMIQMAFIMGIRELYLLGVDFSFEVPSRKNVAGQLISTGERNHFHLDYRPKGEVWNLPELHLQEVSFQKAKKIFESHGGQIFNATRGGALKVFSRADFGLFF